MPRLVTLEEVVEWVDSSPAITDMFKKHAETSPRPAKMSNVEILKCKGVSPITRLHIVLRPELTDDSTQQAFSIWAARKLAKMPAMARWEDKIRAAVDSKIAWLSGRESRQRVTDLGKEAHWTGDYWSYPFSCTKVARELAFAAAHELTGKEFDRAEKACFKKQIKKLLWLLGEDPE